MSCFVVEDLTINRILATISRGCNDRVYPLKWARPSDDLKRWVEYQHLSELGELMFWMNQEAYKQRYGENALDGQEQSFHYMPVATTPIQAYKFLRCYLYQCLEGDVPQRHLYRLLEDYSKDLATAIVMSSKAYELAEWR